MSAIDKIIQNIVQFRDRRNWKQFHNPKDLSIALSIEANELMENFLWKNEKEIDEIDLQKIKDELADVFAYAFLLVDHYNLDTAQIISEKFEKNEKKYPEDKARGNATKYDKL